MSEPVPADTAEKAADVVVISYPADLSTWGRQQVDTDHFRAWLRKTLGTVSPGDGEDVFVGVGCCGSALDVPLQIEAVEGGRRVGQGTDIEYEVRQACDLSGGWQVQSESGPNV